MTPSTPMVMGKSKCQPGRVIMFSQMKRVFAKQWSGLGSRIMRRQRSVFRVGVSSDESPSKLDISRGIVLVGLDRRGNNRFHADYRYHENGPITLQRFRCHPVKRTSLIDRMP